MALLLSATLNYAWQQCNVLVSIFLFDPLCLNALLLATIALRVLQETGFCRRFEIQQCVACCFLPLDILIEVLAIALANALLLATFALRVLLVLICCCKFENQRCGTWWVLMLEGLIGTLALAAAAIAGHSAVMTGFVASYYVVAGKLSNNDFAASADLLRKAIRTATEICDDSRNLALDFARESDAYQMMQQNQAGFDMVTCVVWSYTAVAWLLAVVDNRIQALRTRESSTEESMPPNNEDAWT